MAARAACVALASAAPLLGACADDGPAPQPVAQAPQSLHPAPPMHLVFHDEFDGTHVSDRRWTRCYWWQRDGGCTIASNHERQWYVPEQATVRDGALHLTAVEAGAAGAGPAKLPYRSGMVSTGRGSSDRDEAPRFSFTYGWVEARVRVPAGAGLWPAVWMLPVAHESRPEIDLLEIDGARPTDLSMHLHTEDADGRDRDAGEHWTRTDWAAGWHVIAVDWQPKSLRWLVDGTEVWRVDGDAVPSEPMYVLANLAVGGDWVGPPDASTPFPAELLVDHVRVWQR